MNIGIDFYDTITADPKWFRKFTEGMMAAGHKVYIISAIHEKNLKDLKRDIRKSHVKGELHPIFFTHYAEVPKLKYLACRELDIEMVFDDREDTCDFLMIKGIKAFQYKAY